MKQTLFFILSFCVFPLISCQEYHAEKSPLEEMVSDYVEKEFPDWLDSRHEGDTLFLSVYFTLYDSNWSVPRIDTTVDLDVVALVGGAVNRMIYPEYYLLPPPPYLPEDDTTYEIEAYVQSLNEAEKYIYGKESVPPVFRDDQEKSDYYDVMWESLMFAIDSLYLLDHALIGYTYYGPVQVVVLADSQVDKKLVASFLKGVDVLDLRPRYIGYKRNVEDDEQHFVGGGEPLNYYSVKSDGQFKRVARIVMD